VTRLETLARIVERKLSQIAHELERAGVRDPGRRPMRELAAILLGDELARARAETRASRLRTATSRYWVAGYPRLLAEWHPSKNGDHFPDEVSYGSHKPIWWTCPKGPDHVWCVAPHGRTARKRGCPYCANRMVSVTNSLATLAGDIAREWHPTRNGKLTPQTVMAKSHRMVWWRCSKNPRHVWCARLSNRWWGRSGCPFCSGQRVTSANALATQFPNLVREWDSERNESLTPRSVASSSHFRVWWRCARDPAHRWKSRIDDRTRHEAGCPVCAGKTPVPRGAHKGRLNALADRFPELAREWDHTRNGNTTPKDVSFGSHFRAWWKCPRDRAHQWQAAVCDRSRGTGCPSCAGKR
jgi:hypothetical protein